MSSTQESIQTKSAPKLAFNAAKGSEASESEVKNCVVSGLQALADMYLKIATRNFEQQVTTITALSSVKTPAEFFELQQSIIRDGFGAAITDGKAIAELTASAFGSTFGLTQIQLPGFVFSGRHSA